MITNANIVITAKQKWFIYQLRKRSCDVEIYVVIWLFFKFSGYNFFVAHVETTTFKSRNEVGRICNRRLRNIIHGLHLNSSEWLHLWLQLTLKRNIDDSVRVYKLITILIGFTFIFCLAQHALNTFTMYSTKCLLTKYYICNKVMFDWK